MPYWSLCFEGPVPWDELVRAAGAVVDALTGQPAAWVDPGRELLDDPNGGVGNAFRHVLTRPEATLSLAQEPGSGNPRDGYGYQRSLELTLPAQKRLLRASEGGYEDGFRRLDLYFDAERPADVDTIRSALRSVLGAERDLSAGASLATRNIAAALPLDEPRALTWLAEAKALGAQAYGWKELLALATQLEGSTPELLARRLREAPHDPTAWREATPETSGLSASVLAEVQRRFDAPAPTDGWRRLEDGLGPISGRMGLQGRLDTLLWGEALPYESGLVRAADAGGSSLRTLRAAWAAGELPRMAIEEQGTAGDDDTTTLHLWGDSSSDRVVLRWVVAGPKRRALHLGYAAVAEGSAAFQQRAWAALEALTPCRWEPTPLAALFTERTPRDATRVSRALHRRERVLALLALLGDEALPELEEISRACRCADAYCPHVRRVIDLQRAHGGAAGRASLWAEQCTELALSAALDALIAVLQKRPERVDQAVERAEQHLATRDSLRPGVTVSEVRF